MLINGRRPVLLGSTPIQFFSSRFEFTNDAMVDADGPVPRQSLGLRLDRTVSDAVHEDIDLVNYASRPVRLTIEVAILSDFADIFDVKSEPARAPWRAQHALVPVPRRAAHDLREPRFSTGPRRRRGTRVVAATVRQRPPGVRGDDPAQGRLAHLPEVAAGDPLEAPARDPGLQRRRRAAAQGRRAHLPNVSVHVRRTRRSIEPGTRPCATWRRCGSRTRPFERGVFIPAAGVPWFVTLFGRDSLIVSMQGISGFPEFAAGRCAGCRSCRRPRTTPNATWSRQDPARDPARELAQLGILPYQPYYGTHDATSLFVIVLSYLYHWMGGPERAPALPAQCRGRDGLDRPVGGSRRRWSPGVQDPLDPRLLQPGLEGRGRRHHRSGRHVSPLPIATCELQGYVFDAKIRMADIYDVLERPQDAAVSAARHDGCTTGQRDVLVGGGGDLLPGPQRSQGADPQRRLQSRPPAPVGDRAAGTAGRVVRAADGPGHVVRLGVRTLSSDHPTTTRSRTRRARSGRTTTPRSRAASGDTGSPRRPPRWPRASSMPRNGSRRSAFPSSSPGSPADPGQLPGPVSRANVPQAWAAGSVFRFVAILCGLHATTDAEGIPVLRQPGAARLDARHPDPEPARRGRLARYPLHRWGRGRVVEHLEIRGHPRAGTRPPRSADRSGDRGLTQRRARRGGGPRAAAASWQHHRMQPRDDPRS